MVEIFIVGRIRVQNNKLSYFDKFYRFQILLSFLQEREEKEEMERELHSQRDPWDPMDLAQRINLSHAQLFPGSLRSPPNSLFSPLAPQFHLGNSFMSHPSLNNTQV